MSATSCRMASACVDRQRDRTVGASSHAGDIPRARLDPNQVVSKRLKRVLRAVLPGFSDGDDQHDRGDANRDPERRKRAPQLVPQKAAKCLSTENVHPHSETDGCEPRPRLQRHRGRPFGIRRLPRSPDGTTRVPIRFARRRSRSVANGRTVPTNESGVAESDSPCSVRRMTWWIFALISALAASATAILAKIGIKGVPSNLATAVRTGVVLVFAWGIVVFATGDHRVVCDLKTRSVLFLVFVLVSVHGNLVARLFQGAADGARLSCGAHRQAEPGLHDCSRGGRARRVNPVDGRSRRRAHGRVEPSDIGRLTECRHRRTDRRCPSEARHGGAPRRHGHGDHVHERLVGGRDPPSRVHQHEAVDVMKPSLLFASRAIFSSRIAAPEDLPG